MLSLAGAALVWAKGLLHAGSGMLLSPSDGDEPAEQLNQFAVLLLVIRLGRLRLPELLLNHMVLL